MIKVLMGKRKGNAEFEGYFISETFFYIKVVALGCLGY